MIIGNLQRRWSEARPSTFDKETRIVCLDIKEEAQTGENGQEVQGYSYIPIEIDRLRDYGHVKSQLIEAGFAQKDEFALVNNAVADIVQAIEESETFAEFKANVQTEDVVKFMDFNDFRIACAEAAKVVLEA